MDIRATRLAILLREEDVNQLLTYRDAYNSLRDAFLMLDKKVAVNTKRVRTSLSGATLSYQAGGIGEYLGFKTFVMGSFISLLFSNSGELLLVAESDRLTQIRTGALAVLASDYIKRDYSSVGIIGLGKQGIAQVEAFSNLKSVTINVFSRSPERVTKALSVLKNQGIEVNPKKSYKDLCQDSDVVVTITSSKDPFLKLDFLRRSQHLNLMGSNIEERVEAFPDVIKASNMIVVEDLEQAMEEAGDLILANKMKMLDLNKVFSLSSIIAGRVNVNREGITIFKSVGIGLEDVALLKFIYEESKRRGLGTEVELKGRWRPELARK